MLKTLAILVLVTLIAHPAAAQDAAGPSLSEQAIQAVELRVRAERWARWRVAPCGCSGWRQAPAW